MEIFYINLRTSTRRNYQMQKHLTRLGFPYQRIEAIDINSNTTNNYNLSSTSLTCSSSTIAPLHIHVPFYRWKSLRINRLCISDINNIFEIACTISHILAILTALESTNTHEYAMVLEDDMMIAYDIDFKKLGAELPKDFAIIQLFSKNYINAGIHADKYDSEGVLYVPWKPHHWSTGGYLINKRVLRQVLAPLLQKNNNKDIFDMDLISADNVTKTPSDCFVGSLEGGVSYPCVLSRFDVPGHGLLGGIAADYYIFCLAYGRTYTLTVPLIQANNLAYQSTISDKNADHSRVSIDTSRLAILDTYWGHMRVPPYCRLNAFEIYYINHPTAVKGKYRDKEIRDFLYGVGYSYQRVEAVTIKSTKLAAKLAECSYPCTKDSKSISFSASIQNSKYVRIDKCCVAPSNTRHDLAVTLSHLKAILQAITSENINPHTLIIEDDMILVSESVDIEMFIEQFPSDFSAIQVALLARHALSDPVLERVRDNVEYFDWEHRMSNSRAYIINKPVLLRGLQGTGLLSQRGKKVFHVDLVALSVHMERGGRTVCSPSWCCDLNATIIKRHTCVPSSDQGIAAQSYIYNLLSMFGAVYVSPAPLVVSNPRLCTRGDWHCEVLRKNNIKLSKHLNSSYL